MIGPLEIMLVGVVALLVFGPEKLPEMARTVGRTANQLRRMAADLKEEFNAELEDDDEDRPAARRPAPGHAAAAESEGAEVEPDGDLGDDAERDDGLGDEVGPDGGSPEGLEREGRLPDDPSAQGSGDDTEPHDLEAGAQRPAPGSRTVPDPSTGADE
jgi:Tat protein translocase TatB subunit